MKPNKSEREYIQLEHTQMNTLRKILNIRQKKCFYCKDKIDFEKDKFSIFNKPTRIVCNNIICLCEATDETTKT